MHDAVICEPLRTPVGRYGGALRDVPVQDLAAQLIRALVDRVSLAPDLVDDVVLGQGYPSGEAPALGRVAALDAGLPTTVPGTQVDRRCGSGLQAVIDSAMRVQTGAARLVVAGGAESMSGVEYYSLSTRWGARGGDQVLHDRLARGRVTAGGREHLLPGGMIETAENLRREYGISREAQDVLAAESHRRALAAQTAGVFDDEIVPILVGQPGREQLVSADEHPRPGTTVETLAALTPVMHFVDAAATVTAGNSSGQNDGAAACIVTSSGFAARLGLRPLARLRSWAVVGCEPETMGLGPVGATALALERAGVTLQDVGLIELNEAFAAQVLAVLHEWDVDPQDPRVNQHGSGIALGHPIGATGARILTTIVREMHRGKAELALETMCIGGGQGIAAVFERID